MTTLTSGFDLLFYMGFHDYIGISPYIFILFTNLFEDLISMRYTIIAYSVINANITPSKVEASIFSILAGVTNLGFGVIGSLHGNFWASFLELRKGHLGNMY